MGYSNRGPASLAVGRFDKYSYPRGGSDAVIQHAHLVIRKMHRLKARIVRHQGLAQSQIQGVNRPIADGGRARTPALRTFDHDDGFAERRLLLVPFVVEDPEAHEVEVRLRQYAHRPNHHKLK